jgi:hypothetical protein
MRDAVTAVACKILGMHLRVPSPSVRLPRARVLTASISRGLSSSSGAQASSPSSDPLTKPAVLPWSEYLAIRRGKRKWEIVCFFLIELICYITLST